MAWRIRRTFRLLPGLRLNVSKGGTSVSVGGRGATVNLGKRGTRYTLGLPGSGISYSALEPHGPAARPPRRHVWRWLLVIAAGGAALLAMLR